MSLMKLWTLENHGNDSNRTQETLYNPLSQPQQQSQQQQKKTRKAIML